MKPIPRKKLEKSLLTEKINKSMKKQREVNSHRVFQFTGKLQENLKKAFFKFFLLKKLPLRQEKVLVLGENAYFCIKIVCLLEKNWLGYFLRISFFSASWFFRKWQFLVGGKKISGCCKDHTEVDFHSIVVYDNDWTFPNLNLILEV